MTAKKTSRTPAQSKSRATANATAAAKSVKTAQNVKAAQSIKADQSVKAAQSMKPVVSASKAAANGFGEFAFLGQANFEAFVQSNTAFTRGFEVITQEILAFAQKTADDSVSQARALISAKSLEEAMELQNHFAKRRLEETLSETAKLTELSTRVANEAIEPIQKRVDATVETVLKAQAA